MPHRVGYACINMELKESQKIHCNRGMIRRTFDAKGIRYASELSLKNCRDLIQVIRWNVANNVEVFRMTSCLFPWASEYQLEDLPDWEAIQLALQAAGRIALKHGQRLSFHPGPFNVLASPKEDVVQKAVVDLTIHGKIMDALGMPRSPGAKINIHVGGAYGDRQAALDRFCRNFELLPDAVKTRLTVENDDRLNLYSAKMLYDGVYKQIGIPIVFDSLHYANGPLDTDYSDALCMAVDSWPTDVRPCCHHSNSRKLEDDKAKSAAHSDWYYTPFDDCDFDVDVVLESKMKERALKKYIADFAGDDDSENCEAA